MISKCSAKAHGEQTDTLLVSFYSSYNFIKKISFQICIVNLSSSSKLFVQLKGVVFPSEKKKKKNFQRPHHQMLKYSNKNTTAVTTLFPLLNYLCIYCILHESWRLEAFLQSQVILKYIPYKE